MSLPIFSVSITIPVHGRSFSFWQAWYTTLQIIATLVGTDEGAPVLSPRGCIYKMVWTPNSSNSCFRFSFFAILGGLAWLGFRRPGGSVVAIRQSMWLGRQLSLLRSEASAWTGESVDMDTKE
jgi:hypothetical protein